MLCSILNVKEEEVFCFLYCVLEECFFIFIFVNICSLLDERLFWEKKFVLLIGFLFCEFYLRKLFKCFVDVFLLVI